MSLVVQRIRIRLPMQGAWVWSLVWDDATCCGIGKPMHKNYLSLRSRAQEPQLPSLCSSAQEPQLLKPWAPQCVCTTMKSNPCSPQPEKACAKQFRPSAAKKTQNQACLRPHHSASHPSYDDTQFQPPPREARSTQPSTGCGAQQTQCLFLSTVLSLPSSGLREITSEHFLCQALHWVPYVHWII